MKLSDYSKTEDSLGLGLNDYERMVSGIAACDCETPWGPVKEGHHITEVVSTHRMKACAGIDQLQPLGQTEGIPAVRGRIAPRREAAFAGADYQAQDGAGAVRRMRVLAWYCAVSRSDVQAISDACRNWARKLVRGMEGQDVKALFWTMAVFTWLISLAMMFSVIFHTPDPNESHVAEMAQAVYVTIMALMVAYLPFPHLRDINR